MSLTGTMIGLIMMGVPAGILTVSFAGMMNWLTWVIGAFVFCLGVVTIIITAEQNEKE